MCVFGDVAGAPTTIGRLAVDSSRFEFTDTRGRLWNCRIELGATDFYPDSERQQQNVSAIARQVRQLFPARCRVGVLELASSWSLFEATVAVPRITGEVIVKLARVNMPEPSDASGWGERVDSPDGKHRWYFGNDGMDPAFFAELIRVAKTRLP